MRNILKKLYYIRKILGFIFIVEDKCSYLFFILVSFINNSKKYTLLRLKNGEKFVVRNLYDIVVLQEVFQDLIYKSLFNYVSGKNPTYIDIGGYIGDTAVFFSKSNLFKKIIVFEPLPHNFILLEKNIEINGIAHTTNLIKSAVVSDSKKISNFYIDNNFGKSGVYSNKSSLKKVAVHAINISNILKNLGNVYLKIDCEGAEFELLRSLSANEFNKISAIILEYHSEYYDIKLLISLLKQNKFKINIIPHEVENDIGLILATKK